MLALNCARGRFNIRGIAGTHTSAQATRRSTRALSSAGTPWRRPAWWTYTDSNTRERRPYEADGIIASTGRLLLQRDFLWGRHSHAWVIEFPTCPVEWQIGTPFLGYQVFMATGPDLAVAFAEQMFNRTMISYRDAANAMGWSRRSTTAPCTTGAAAVTLACGSSIGCPTRPSLQRARATTRCNWASSLPATAPQLTTFCAEGARGAGVHSGHHPAADCIGGERSETGHQGQDVERKFKHVLRRHLRGSWGATRG